LLEKKRGYEISGYSWMFEAMYQLHPPAVLDAEFNPGWFGEQVMFTDWPSDDAIRFKVMYVDPSMGKTDKADYSAIIMLALDFHGTMWIDCNMDRRDPWKIVEDGFQLAKQFKPHRFGVEGIQFQEVLGDMFEQKSKAHGFMLPLSMHNPVENKIVRIRRDLTPYLARGEFRFKRGSPGVNLLLEQLKGFPAHKFDDGPDALQGALAVARHLFQNGPI